MDEPVELNMEDTIAATYESMRGAFEGDDGKTPEPLSKEAPIDIPDEPEEIDPVEPKAEDAPVEEEEAPSEQPAFKPKWKKTELEEWDKIPEAARKAIERRENDFHKGIEQYKGKASVAEEWEKTVSPFMATIQSFNVSPQVAVQELFKADHLLRYSPPEQKIGALLKLANSYGVDINALANGIQRVAGEKVWEQQNPVDPNVQRLQSELAELKQYHITQQQHAQMVEHSSTEQAIAEFAADPDHEHFPILRKDMGVLISNGLAKNMDDAYEMAMRQNPQTCQIWLAQQQQEWDAKRKATVAKAKQAGANVVRPNGRANVPSANPTRTMDEDIEATARALGLL